MNMYSRITLAILVLMLATFASAQNPASATTQITATKSESLTISAPASLAAFSIDAAGPTAGKSLAITSTWNLTPSRASVDVCAVGAPLTASNVSNTDSIPVTNIEIDPGTGTFAAINSGGAHCSQPAATLVNHHLLSTDGRKNVSKTDTVNIRLNGYPTTLQADTYTGSITVFAYVQ